MKKILLILVLAALLAGCGKTVMYDWTIDSYKVKPENDWSDYNAELGPKELPSDK